VPAKLGFKEVNTLFESRGFTLLETEYINSETPLMYICNCGNKSKMSYKNAKKGKSCAECGRKKASETKTKYNINSIKKYFEERDCKLISTVYETGGKAKLDYLCVCGNKASIAWRHALYNGINCKECGFTKIADSKRKYTTEDVRELFAHQGKTLLETEFKNSQIPLQYICKCGNESQINLNNFFKGEDCYGCRNDKISEAKKDPNLTDEERALRRNLRANKEFRVSVFQRDDYTCQCCEERGKEINAHHIFNFADNPEVRTDIENGITLCVECHATFHKRYGKRNTTRDQLDEFRAVNNDG
jgi:hypothetical protein